MDLAQRIQHLRKEKGLSQEELAEALGVSRQAVSKWESAQSTPDVEKIVAMSRYFAVTTDYLLMGVQGHEPNAVQTKQTRPLSGQILFLCSAALMAMGLILAIGSWYEAQTATCVWGGLMLQVCGGLVYGIGVLLSKVQGQFWVQFVNVCLAAFLLFSALITLVAEGIPAPYPFGLRSLAVFAVLYTGFVAMIYRAMKKRLAAV